jgi:hypothetical protein
MLMTKLKICQKLWNSQNMNRTNQQKMTFHELIQKDNYLPHSNLSKLLFQLIFGELMQEDYDIEIHFLTFFSKFFFRFGTNSLFELLDEFVNQNGINIFKNGFFIFENIQSVLRRLETSDSNWAIIPDPHFHSSRFLLFLKQNDKIENFSIELKHHFESFQNDEFFFEIKGEYFQREVNARFYDVLNELHVDQSKGLPQEKSISIILKAFPNCSFSQKYQHFDFDLNYLFLFEDFDNFPM